MAGFTFTFAVRCETVVSAECVQGDIVAVVRRLDDNWFEGLHDGRQGLFPVAYAELVRSPVFP